MGAFACQTVLSDTNVELINYPLARELPGIAVITCNGHAGVLFMLVLLCLL